MIELVKESLQSKLQYELITKTNYNMNLLAHSITFWFWNGGWS